MKILRYCLLCFVCIGMLYAWANPQVQASSGVKFRLNSNHLIIIAVFVNGQGPYDFMLDTGANTTLIRSDFAKKLRVTATTYTALNTVSGSQFLYRTRIDTIAVSSHQVKHLEVMITDPQKIRVFDARIQGILGQDFLTQFHNIVLDYRNHRIEFEGNEDQKNSSPVLTTPPGEQ